MAYIGNSPANVGSYQEVDTISTFNGSLTSFALTAGSSAISPAKSGQLLVSLNGVMQEPDDTGTNGFKVSGSNIVFSSAPATGSTFWAMFQGNNVDVGTPSAGVVGLTELSATGTASATTFLRGDNTWVVPTDTNTDTKWDGGTTGLTAATGRTSLGLAIGTDDQAYSANTAITTADTSWTGSQRGTPSVVTDGTLDLNTANNFKYTPAASPDTLEFTNETAGQSGFITVINASGHTIATGSEVKKSSTWDVSTAGTYLVSYYSDGTNVYLSASAALA